jgi:hypothetical protein
MGLQGREYHKKQTGAEALTCDGREDDKNRLVL